MEYDEAADRLRRARKALVTALDRARKSLQGALERVLGELDTLPVVGAEGPETFGQGENSVSAMAVDQVGSVGPGDDRRR